MIRYQLRSRFTSAILIASVCVVVSAAETSPSYIVLLRFVLSGLSVILLLEAKRVLRDWHRWLLVGTAVLHNPVFPIELEDRAIWTVLNFATATLFWVVESHYGWPFQLSRTRAAGSVTTAPTPSPPFESVLGGESVFHSL